MKESKKYENLVALFDKQLEFAQNLQKKIIPKQGTFHSDYYHFCSYLKPFRKVGGDFYDYKLLDQDCVNLILADATGHGIDAAMITSMIKLIYSYSMKDPLLSKSPSLLLKQLEKDICNLLTNTFFTATAILLDPLNHCLYYSNAGHPHGVIIRANGEIDLLNPTLPMIGLHQLMLDIVYVDKKLDFSVGDKLILLTDGLIDARNFDGEEFSSERVVSIVKKSFDLSITRICENIIDDFKDFKLSKDQSDDVCILGIEYDK